MKFINLGSIDIKFLIPVFGGIIYLINNIFINYNPKIEIIVENPFLFNMYIYFGLIFAIIPFIVVKYKSKAANKIYNKQIIKSELYKKLTDSKDVIKNTKYKKYRFILYSIIFDFLQTLFTTLLIPYILYNLWFFDIIFMSLFSYLILKTKYYKHQFVSMIAIVILGLGLNIITYFKLEDTEEGGFNFFDIFIKFISEICFCLLVVLWKYSMEKTYCNPYELCLFVGVLGFILQSICLTIFCLFELSAYGIKHPDNLIQYFNEYDYNDFIICIVTIIVYFIFNISIILTCDYFTPIHILIISIIGETYGNFEIGSNLALNILGFIFILLIFIMFLVFIEVIEINIYNLSYNTKRNIKLRSKNDTLIELEAIYLTNQEAEFDEERESNATSSNYILN